MAPPLEEPAWEGVALPGRVFKQRHVLPQRCSGQGVIKHLPIVLLVVIKYSSPCRMIRGVTGTGECVHKCTAALAGANLR